MAKRKNRVRALTHEMDAIENLKALDPITTPDEWRSFSESLLDIAIIALEVTRQLEVSGQMNRSDIVNLALLVNALPRLAPEEDDD